MEPLGEALRDVKGTTGSAGTQCAWRAEHRRRLPPQGARKVRDRGEVSNCTAPGSPLTHELGAAFDRQSRGAHRYRSVVAPSGSDAGLDLGCSIIATRLGASSGDPAGMGLHVATVADLRFAV